MEHNIPSVFNTFRTKPGFVKPFVRFWNFALLALISTVDGRWRVSPIFSKKNTYSLKIITLYDARLYQNCLVFFNGLTYCFAAILFTKDSLTFNVFYMETKLDPWNWNCCVFYFLLFLYLNSSA